MYKLIPHHKYDIFGKDSLMFSALPYYFLPVLSAISFPLYQATSPFLIILIGYTLIPLFDEIFVFDKRNPTQKQRQVLQENDFHFKLALYAAVVADWWVFYKIMEEYSTINVFDIKQLLNLLAFIFLTWTAGAAAIAVAHQIFHKQSMFDRALGTIHMSKYLLMHFTVEHLYGHHRNVATPLDHASAEKGVSVYEFIPKAMVGDYTSTYKIDKERGKPIYMNCAIQSIIINIIIIITIYKIYNLQALVFFLIQAIGSIMFLQAINYIEHYGLRRLRKQNGQYQKVTIRHSWNAPHRFTNYLLFKLQRHSDHHENSLKPYQILDSIQQAPQLPHGYTVMLIMCFFPSVWSSVMDPLVQEYEKKQKGSISSKIIEQSVEKTKAFIAKFTALNCMCMMIGTMAR